MMKRFAIVAGVLFPSLGWPLALPVAEVTGIAEAYSRKCPGTVVAIARVDIIPQVSGEILSVGFANGQEVKKGDVLYRLDPVKYAAAVKTAEARVAEAKAVYDYAGVTCLRYAELVKTRAVSQDECDKSSSARDTAAAELAAAEANLQAAKDDLKHCTITAPISGRIGTTAYTEGNYMIKGGPAMVTLVQENPIRVRFRMSGVDYRDIYDANRENIASNGVPMIRLVSTDASVVTGRVEYIENLVDRATDTVGVYALLENSGGLFLDGQVVMVEFCNRGGRILPSVPLTAIVQDTMGPYVWILDDQGRAAKRRIIRASRVGERQLIAAGVVLGERVVADGVHRVRTGMRIERECGR